MFGVSVTLILKNYYKSNSGIPRPSVLATPVYAFTLLLLMAEFLQALPLFFGAAVTMSLYLQSEQQAKNVKPKITSTGSNAKETAASPGRNR